MRKLDSALSRTDYIRSGAPDGNNFSDDAPYKHIASAMPRKRQSLTVKMTIVMLGAAVIQFPMSWFALLQGEYVPIIMAFLVLAAGVNSVSCARRARWESAMYAETVSIVIGGLLLTIVDPAIFDPGLAMICLAPVHLAVAGGHTNGKNVWLILAGLALFSGICTAGYLPDLLQAGTIVGWTGTIYCAALILTHIYSAIRLYELGEDRAHAHNIAIRHLAEHMGDGYVRFAVDGRVRFASKHTEELLGVNRYELVGEGLNDRIHILDRPVFLKNFSDSVHSGKSRLVEARLRKDELVKGSNSPDYVWIEIMFSPITDPDIAEEKWEVVALLRDVTERKEHEFELIAARKIAEEASNTKSGFLATIGHELRTPLNAIVGFSEIMSNGIGGELAPAHAEYAQLIHQSGHHLLDVVNMLLDMSKIEAGKFELQLTRFEPNDLVRPCIQMIETNAREKDVRIEVELAKNLPALTGDERACRQILINLLSNAVKFSKPGGTVSVSVKRQGQKLNISVMDSGIGMSVEAASRVGEAFFQAHDGLTRQYEGTGLGMSIVKGLVELHEGALSIDSELGHGTTVTLLMPLNGPRTRFVEPEKLIPMPKGTTQIQPGQWPEQKRIAL